MRSSAGWTAVGSDPWVELLSGSSGAGDGTVAYAVDWNPTLRPRSAAIAVSAPGTNAVFAIRQAGGSSTTEGAVVIGTAQGDIHDIGKNMVALMLQVNGFRVTDLGTNVATQAILDAARRENADIIALSSLLTTSLPFVKDVLARLDAAGERSRFMVVAGGAPVTVEWSVAAGLDGFAEDAVEAVAMCRGLMARRRGVAA